MRCLGRELDELPVLFAALSQAVSLAVMPEVRPAPSLLPLVERLDRRLSPRDLFHFLIPASTPDEENVLEHDPSGVPQPSPPPAAVRRTPIAASRRRQEMSAATTGRSRNDTFPVPVEARDPKSRRHGNGSRAPRFRWIKSADTGIWAMAMTCLVSGLPGRVSAR